METYRYIYRRDGALIFTSERMTEALAELMTRSGLAIAARTDPGVTAEIFEDQDNFEEARDYHPYGDPQT